MGLMMEWNVESMEALFHAGVAFGKAWERRRPRLNEAKQNLIQPEQNLSVCLSEPCWPRVARQQACLLERA